MNVTMKCKEYLQELKRKAESLDLSYNIYHVAHYDKEYPMPKIETKHNEKKQVLITAGFHGDEIAGPLTILYELKNIVNHAAANDVGLIIYPLVNPSGFEKRTRFNLNGQKPNNDFLRYNVDNNWIKDIEDSKKDYEWRWSSDILKSIPLEAKILQDEFKKLDFDKLKGFIDLHQDDFGNYTGTYAYIYDDNQIYAPIMEKISQIMPVVKNIDIGAGFNTTVYSNEYGILFRHDGSIHDMFFRMNVPYSVTVETTTNTSIADAIKVNLTWIEEIIALGSKN